MSSWSQHLILVGPMGSGKSCVGRAAASALRMPFVDTDQLVENATCRSIKQIFEECGEEGFRRAETLALQRLLFIPSAVVATGGGAVLRDENWEYMAASGLVVRLKVSPEESLRRTEGDNNRPLLSGATDRLERLRQLHAERESFYARAHHTISADNRSVQDVTRELVELFTRWRAPACR